tara:strand:+ start:2274 stop:2492 length:219 start_codon:yes stop_codon:yes gene_type:complete
MENINKEYALIQSKIKNMYNYLNDTIWVNDKRVDIVEVLKTMTNEEYNSKYFEIYQKRKEARAFINENEENK